MSKQWKNIRSKAIEDTIDQALDVITDEQLFKEGIDGDGNKLPLPYAPFTVEIKRILNQPTDRITLKDSGDFYAGVYGKVLNDNVLVSSKDWKTSMLEKDWGDSILSMTQDNTKKYARDAVLPEVQDSTKKMLGL